LSLAEQRTDQLKRELEEAMTRIEQAESNVRKLHERLKVQSVDHKVSME